MIMLQGRVKDAALLISSLFGVICALAAQQGSGRPVQYSLDWPQFMVYSWADTRTITIMRPGAGRERPAEFTVFEMLDEGALLRPLHQATLKNPFLPWTWISTGGGRFLVTLDDRWVEGRTTEAQKATTENCLVIYDFVRGTAVARSAEEFLPKLESEHWFGPWLAVDPLRSQVYLAWPEDCRSGGKPFVIVDLPSMRPRIEPQIPDSLPAGVIKPFEGCGLLWEWSSGASLEPTWKAPKGLPEFLRAKVDAKEADLKRVGLSNKEYFFQLDRQSGCYLKCSPDKWVDRPVGDGKTNLERGEHEKKK